ncbi:MAG: metalloregulator ArsR/SmtB family transcription factor [Acidobacteriota bacterium]
MKGESEHETHVPAEGADEDAVWKALADPSRRHMLDLLRRRPHTTGELAEAFEFSRYAVMKHLKVLHEAGLILYERRGRERINRLNPLPIRRIYRRWIRPFEELASDRLLRLEQVVAQRAERGDSSGTGDSSDDTTDDEQGDTS